MLFIYICIYICMYIYTFIYIYIYIYVYIYINIYIYKYIDIHKYICMNEYVYMYLCRCVCIYIYIVYIYREAAHAIAKSLITINPHVLSVHLRLGSIEPLLFLCKGIYMYNYIHVYVDKITCLNI
jgi:hypothetical protein